MGVTQNCSHSPPAWLLPPPPPPAPRTPSLQDYKGRSEGGRCRHRCQATCGFCICLQLLWRAFCINFPFTAHPPHTSEMYPQKFLKASLSSPLSPRHPFPQAPSLVHLKAPSSSSQLPCLAQHYILLVGATVLTQKFTNDSNYFLSSVYFMPVF